MNGQNYQPYQPQVNQPYNQPNLPQATHTQQNNAQEFRSPLGIQQHNYGAHEILEAHEVLTDTIDGINQFQLYRPHCQDSELRRILDNQLRFMTNEYNTLVQALNQSGTGAAGNQSYRAVQSFAPVYGLDNPTAEAPNMSLRQMDDRDVASGMMGCHKASATMRMHAALECADPQLRSLMLQGAKNCADQAYEIWNYMNKKGYYQVPTLNHRTMNTFMNQYQPATTGMTTPQLSVQ